MAKLPIQPACTDEHGAIRFRENKVACALLDIGGLDLNRLARTLPGCREDGQQFAQLVGYSRPGFGDLS